MKKKPAKQRAKQPIAVITADTHLHPTTWVNRPTLHGDAFFAFSQVQQYCEDRDIGHMIIAGDILDRRVNDAETPKFVRLAMEAARGNRARVLYIQGQHDMQAEPWLSSLSGWPFHLNRTAVLLGDFKVYGIDWTRLSEMQEALDSIPEGTDILVMHQVCTEFMGGVRECELTVATVPHVKMIIMGDYHVHEKRTLRMTDGRKVLLVSPGSTCMQKIDEEPAKNFYVLYDDLSVESQPLRGRRVISASGMVTHEQVDEFVQNVEGAIEDVVARAAQDGLPDALIKPILRVEYATDLEGAGRRIRRAVGGDAFLFEKQLSSEDSEDKGKVMAGDKARKLMDQAGLSGFLPRVLDRKHEKKLFLFCKELLDSFEPLEVIAAWRHKFGLTQEKDDAELAETP